MSHSGRSLTERQQSVMERIDRRVPIKVIAQEMGVSETRINQHIRALKNIYSAGSLNELVENYRKSQASDSKDLKGFSESAFTNSQVPQSDTFGQTLSQDNPGKIVLNDVMPIGDAPWQTASEPQIVPGVLDGRNAVWLRLAAIAAIFFGILASVVLVITAGMMIGELLEGKAEISKEYLGSDE